MGTDTCVPSLRKGLSLSKSFPLAGGTPASLQIRRGEFFTKLEGKKIDSSPEKEEKRALLFLAIPLRDFSTALIAPS